MLEQRAVWPTDSRTTVSVIPDERTAPRGPGVMTNVDGADRSTARPEDRIRICVLERVSVRPRADVLVPIGSLQQKLFLTLLVAYGTRSVPVDVIADELWGDHRPRRWLASIRTLANSLRRTACDRDFVHWTGRGYTLHEDFERVSTDVAEMVQAVDEARVALRGGHLDGAERAARRALSLYGGGPWTTDCWHWGDVAADAYYLLGRALLDQESHLRCILELSQAPEELQWHDGIRACLARGRAAGAMRLAVG